MKYILLALWVVLKQIAFFVARCYLTIMLIIERIAKVISILGLILWYFSFDRKWLERFQSYVMVIPFPVGGPMPAALPLPFHVPTLKDIYTFQNYTLITAKDEK